MGLGTRRTDPRQVLGTMSRPRQNGVGSEIPMTEFAINANMSNSSGFSTLAPELSGHMRIIIGGSLPSKKLRLEYEFRKPGEST